MTILLSLLVALIGLLLYAFSTNAKLSEVGRICFFCGLLSFLLQANEHMIALISR